MQGSVQQTSKSSERVSLAGLSEFTEARSLISKAGRGAHVKNAAPLGGLHGALDVGHGADVLAEQRQHLDAPPHASRSDTAGCRPSLSPAPVQSTFGSTSLPAQ